MTTRLDEVNSDHRLVLRMRKVKVETRTRRRRDGTREPSRCCTVYR